MSSDLFCPSAALRRTGRVTSSGLSVYVLYIAQNTRHLATANGSRFDLLTLKVVSESRSRYKIFLTRAGSVVNPVKVFLKNLIRNRQQISELF